MSKVIVCHQVNCDDSDGVVDLMDQCVSHLDHLGHGKNQQVEVVITVYSKGDDGYDDSLDEDDGSDNEDEPE